MTSKIHAPDVEPELLAVVTAASAEARRRSAGGFDGLLGKLPTDTAGLLQRILERVRDDLLATYHDDDIGKRDQRIRDLLAEHGWPSGGFRAVTPVSDSTRLALAILWEFSAVALDNGPISTDLSELIEAAGLDKERQFFGKAGKQSRARLANAGEQSARTRQSEAAAWHRVCETRALRLLGNGDEFKTVVDRLAREHDKTEARIRQVLRKAGIHDPKKRAKTS